MATSKGLQNHKSLKMIFCFCLIFSAAELTQARFRKEDKFALNYHNKLRRKENASNMIKLIWSKKLKYEASAYVELCKFELQNKGRGENMAFNINPGSTIKHIKNAIDAWFSEKGDVKWSGNECTSGCHYTQLVWAKTTEIGCASVRCPSLKAFGKETKNAFFFVCFYNPKGNTGDPAYLTGTPCSECPETTKCEKELCVSDPANKDRGKFMSGSGTTGNSTDNGTVINAGIDTDNSPADCRDRLPTKVCKHMFTRILNHFNWRLIRRSCQKTMKAC